MSLTLTLVQSEFWMTPRNALKCTMHFSTTTSPFPSLEILDTNGPAVVQPVSANIPIINVCFMI